MAEDRWMALSSQIIACTKCPRLREYCLRVARQKRRAYADVRYWGLPVPNFGSSRARLLIIGLAPAAHGANRTGRMFTGDRSGEWLYRALYEAGFANQPLSQSRDDGLRLQDCAITAVCHCAPPANRPTAEEMSACADWLRQTFSAVPARVFLALGHIAFNATIEEVRRRDWYQGPRPAFRHGERLQLSGGRWLVTSYHPSQQNTFTGRLTRPMFDKVFSSIREIL
jgi:uracil-DNA glycosylase family 4